MASVDGTPILVGGGLQPAGQTLESRAQDIENELIALRNKLSPLIDAWSQSRAATYYQSCMADWDTAARTLFGSEAEVGVLGTIAAVVRQSWTNYQIEEEANISTWRTS
ncbi:WXG100 family type VII secretion target [Streptacidiphilus sp. ASG 303]|uniref:WXG100 family type VII secretion target n=1 Tax=Streptacidiphilus sp. ASG 303 TaxID=2896847 RepID=UPI001E589C1E|nr:WXG100 family type VII secretion target [Streptacidiphilus sp. ASG 303]MCD0484783.1 WXG100 family type VII secretion target [Streptacidiphilus sp. ASG 303]